LRSGFVFWQDLRRIEQALDAFRKALETVGLRQDIVNADGGHDRLVAQHLIVHREQYDPYIRHPGAQERGYFRTVLMGHSKIQKNEAGLQFVRLFEDIIPIDCFAANFEMVLGEVGTNGFSK
jgi:hypothetical protein